MFEECWEPFVIHLIQLLLFNTSLNHDFSEPSDVAYVSR
jgi:hypothetical protein